MFRIGQGFDIHKFDINKKKIILGGINIPFHKGLLGYSDADVLLHSIIDSMLGALGLNDIGCLFPDNDLKFKNISSIILLKKVNKIINKKKFIICNIDCNILIEEPKIKYYFEKIKKKISSICMINKNKVNIKAKTFETLGCIGNKKGVAALSIILLKKMEVKK